MRRRWLLSLTAFAAMPAKAQAPWHGVAAGEVLRGRFTQERQIKGFAHPLLSSGSFVLAPGQGLIWRTEQPFAIVTIITAAGLVQQAEGTETTRLSAAQLPFIARLYDLLGGALGGNWQSLTRDFQATQGGDAARWELVLAPRAGADPLTMPFRAITLRGGRFVDEVDITRPDDGFDRLRFSGQTLAGGALSAAEAALIREVSP